MYIFVVRPILYNLKTFYYLSILKCFIPFYKYVIGKNKCSVQLLYINHVFNIKMINIVANILMYIFNTLLYIIHIM